MPINQKVKQIYDTLKGGGADVGTEQEFNDWFLAKGDQGYQNRKNVYTTLRDGGADAGSSYEEFKGWLGLKPTPAAVQHNNSAGVSPSTPAASKPKQNTFFGQMRNPVGMMVDKVSEVPKRNQLPQPKYAQQISQDDIARYNQTIAGAYSTARRANEQTDNILEYSKQRINNPLGQADVQLGEVNDRPSLAGSKNLVKGDVEYNPETGKLEQSYLTQAGSKHYNKGLAEMEQQQIDKARWEQLHPVEAELEEAYAERDRLLQEQEDAAKNVRENTDETALAQYAAYNEGNPYWSIDKRYTDYDSALRKNKSRIKLLEAKKRGKEAGFWAGFMDTTTDPDTWLFGIPGLIDSGKLYGIKEKMDSGMKLSKSEKSLIAETAKGVQAEQRYGGDLTSLYRWGNIASAALPFVAEFMTTGGFSSVAQGIAGVGERAAAKYASNAATKWLIKNTGVLAGDVASGFLMANTTGSAKTASDILNRNMGTVVQDENGKFKFVGGEGLLPSIAKAEISQTLEYYTEKLGEHLNIGKFLSKGAEKIGLSKVSKAVNYLSNNKWLSKGGVQDYPSEVFEEEANIVLNALLVGDNQLSDLWDGKTQADIWGGMAFSIGLMNAPKYANTGYQTAQYYRYKHKTNKADKLAGYKLTDEVWQPLRDEIDNTDNDEMSGVVFGIASSENLNEEQKRTALDYVKNLCEMRGYNMGLLNEFKEPDNITAVENEDANGVGNSYTQGYSSENESDMQDIKNRMEMIREGMDGLFDGDFISQLDEDPAGTLKAVRDMVSLSDTQKRMVIDYVNAKSAYDGMIQRVRDDIDSETAQSDEMINSRVASEEHGGDGMIHPATLKEGDRKVYVVSGNVLMTEDGSMVDTQRSDEDLIVRDAETGKLEFVSSGDILSTDESLDAEQLKEEARQQIHENIARQAVNKIDGVLPFNIGDEYDVADYNGNPHKVRVLSVDVDNVVIDMDGAERTLPQQTIQEMADMANRSRVNIESNESDEAEAIQETGTPQEEQAEAFPILENGEPDFSQAEPARTYEYLFNEDSSGIPADAADEFVSNMRKESAKMLERINNKKPKIGTNITKFKSEMEAWNAERSDAERAAAYWDSVNELRDSEKKRIADEELMDNRDHYIAESKNKSDAWNRAAQMYGDVPVANFQYDDTYDTLEEYVAENIPYNSINWNSYDVNGVKHVGLKDETGLGEAERRRFLTYLAKSGNGNSLSNVIHELFENMPENLASQGYTDHDVRNALIGLFLNAGSSKDISLYRLNNRIAAAEKFLQEEKELEENARYAAEQEIIEWQEYWETVDVSHYTEEVDSFLAEQNNKFENGTEENDGSEGLDREPATGGVSDGNQESAGTLQGEETAKSAVETDDTDTERRGRETAAAESVDNGADESIPLENGAGEKLSTLAVAEQETNTEPTDAQKEAGNEEVEDNATYRDYDDDESGNDTYAARRWRNAHILANDWIEKLNIGDVVKVYDSIDDVPNSRQFSKRKRSAKGWYDTKTGEIVIIMGNHRGEQDVLRTILHEAVAHYGLRKLFGSNFDNFLDNVYNAANIDIKANIMSKVAVLMGKDKNSKRTADEWRRVATEEYLAELAESTDFERAESRSAVHHWFNNIKKLFLSMLHKMGLKDFGSSKNPVLTDNELRYILWRSYKNMTEPGRYRNVFQSAEDVSMQNRLGVGNYSQVGERVDMAADGISSEKDLNNTERVSDIHGNSLSLRQRNKDNEISESVSQGKLGAEDAGNRRIHEISDEIRRRSGIHDSELEEGSGNGSRLEKEQRAAESIAKENGYWIPVDDVFQFGRSGPSGNESDTYISDNGTIYKVNNLMNSGSIVKFLDKISLHNQLFPETRYTFVGFTGFDGRTIMPVVSQHIVMNAHPASEDVISKYMENMGFEHIGEDRYQNEYFEVWDLKPKNVLENERGSIYVIDAEIKSREDTARYRNVFGGNSGYVGYSKSRRAVLAENKGLRNASQMDSGFAEEVNEIISGHNPAAKRVTLKEIKAALKNIKADEWHHTSMYGNKTDYYSALRVADYFEDGVEDAVMEREWQEYQKTIDRHKKNESLLREKRGLYEKADERITSEKIKMRHAGQNKEVSVFKSSNGLMVSVEPKTDGYSFVTWDVEQGRYRMSKYRSDSKNHQKEEAIREMEEARENAITPDERERLNEIEIERNALKEDGKSANDDGALFRDEDSTPRALARDTYERMVMSGREQFSEAMHDSMRSLKNLYRAIIKAEGKKTYIEDVAGFENAYLAENRMSSMSQSQVHAWQKDFIEPLVKEVHRLTGGKDGAYHELLDYLMAKHGLERNVVLAGRDAQKTYEKKTSDGGTADLQEITDKFRERDYSGLTALTGKSSTEEAEEAAREMVEDYEREHDTDELWKRINAATKSSLEKTYMCGLMSRERYEQVREMFSHYVPLQGFDGKVSEDVYSYIGSDGTRMYGTPIRSAKGRKSKADNPLAAIEMNGEAAIRQGNRNIMKQRFLNFVQNHPSDLVSVSDVWLRYNDVTEEWEQFFEADLKEEDTPEEVERKMMEYEERMEKLANDFPDRYKRGSDMTGVPYRVLDKYHMKEHQVMVNRGGKTFVLTINGNPRAAQALNGVTNPDVYSDGVFGITMEMGAFLNRQLSAVYTTRNPEFVVSNYMRDAIYSNSMVWVKENPRYALKFHRNFGKMNPVFLGKLFKEWENGKLRERVAGLPYTSEISETDYLRKRFYEFMTNGGETGWTNLRDIEKHKQDLEKALKRDGSTTRKAWKALAGGFDLVNRSVENNARFAAYLTSREMGRGIDRSIYDAKEISVNFNKKGAGDKFLGSKGQTKLGNIGATVGGAGRGLYVFWNASVQGMTNIARASSRHPFKAAGMVAALYILGYAAPLISQILCGGDDDDDYYNLPEYIRRSNICFRWRKSMPWVTIPLPIEFRAAYGLGELAYGTITGKERYSDEEFAKQFISQISQVLPLDFMEGGGGWHAFVPSVPKPFVEAQTNVGWTGLPIYRENTNPYDPQWKRAYNSANQQIVEATRWVNEATGGDDVAQGWIDWNPAKIEYMLKGYLGGYFTMADRLTKSAETALGKREFEWRNTPLASRVLKQGDERTEDRKIKNQYFDLLDEYKKTQHDLKGYAKEAGSGREDAFKYAERLDFIHHSKEYLHYQLMEYYKPLLDAYHKLGKEADGERGKRIEAEENMLRREFVKLIRAVDDGKDFDFDAHVTGMLDRMLDANEENIQKAAERSFRKYDEQGGVKTNR